MAKMTVRESLEYIEKATGMTYTEELQDKILNFLDKLPHHPSNVQYHHNGGLIVTICDYDYGWFAEVLVENDNGVMNVERRDGDNLDPNPQRVKSNTEALALLNEYSEIKWASDIDEYWNMSDDHKYWRRMNEMNERAFEKQNEIKNKLA